MKLDQFVSQTLISILDGVEKANGEIKKRQTTGGYDYNFLIADWGDHPKDAKYINFDVAVSSSTELAGRAEGVGDIIVASVSLDAGAKQGFENISRVSFKVLCR